MKSIIRDQDEEVLFLNIYPFFFLTSWSSKQDKYETHGNHGLSSCQTESSDDLSSRTREAILVKKPTLVSRVTRHCSLVYYCWMLRCIHSLKHSLTWLSRLHDEDRVKSQVCLVCRDWLPFYLSSWSVGGRTLRPSYSKIISSHNSKVRMSRFLLHLTMNLEVESPITTRVYRFSEPDVTCSVSLVWIQAE